RRLKSLVLPDCWAYLMNPTPFTPFDHAQDRLRQAQGERVMHGDTTSCPKTSFSTDDWIPACAGMTPQAAIPVMPA
ncbi:MAG TPA: hypothetical protein VGX03_39965, partial [Candidatus Binatia bacterium]|nr:hypothetical protein [Candidatus Binatia bacterium]